MVSTPALSGGTVSVWGIRAATSILFGNTSAWRFSERVPMGPLLDLVNFFQTPTKWELRHETDPKAGYPPLTASQTRAPRRHWCYPRLGNHPQEMVSSKGFRM